MNQNIKYLVENILDDFYDDEQHGIIDDFLGYKYFPKTKDELIRIIVEHYENNIFNLNDIDVSQITDFSKLFFTEKYTAHKDFDISHWDVRNGQDFSAMFYNCHNFNCDLSQWDVSNGQDFSYMFLGCKNFNSDLSKWNVSNCKDFSHMFYLCKKFNSDLSQWNVSRCHEFIYMFCRCQEFNSDLSQWDVSQWY